MADVLDVDALLAPPEGSDDPRADPSAISPYRRVKDARSDARDEERARDAEGEEEAPLAEGWRTVLRLGQEVLVAAKDFEVASWLTEALVRQHGLDRLVAGCRLLSGMLDRYWDDGFPTADADGIEDRAIMLGGLSGLNADGTILQPLRRLTLFTRSDNSPLPLYRYDQAEEVAGRPDAEYRQRRHDAGVPELEVVQAEAKAATARTQLRAFGAKAAEALAAWGALDAALTPRFSDYGEVPTSRVTRVLERMVEVTTALGGAPVAEAAATEAGVETVAAGAPGVAGGGGFVLGNTSGAVASREAALETLERIAEFFEKTEPHSFLAYTLRDAVRRGRMTLPELLAEVLSDQTARDGMLTALGIRPTPEDSGSGYS